MTKYEGNEIDCTMNLLILPLLEYHNANFTMQIAQPKFSDMVIINLSLNKATSLSNVKNASH